MCLVCPTDQSGEQPPLPGLRGRLDQEPFVLDRTGVDDIDGCVMPRVRIAADDDATVFDEYIVAVHDMYYDEPLDDPNADFDNIQAAVNAANSGDEIIVNGELYSIAKTDASFVLLRSSNGDYVVIK